MSKSKTNVNFEKSLNELETIINRLEAGQISLEESLSAFEQGVSLARTCQEALKTAEQKVQMLIEKNGALITEPFVVED
jgi:exodeoxyribonuclease VII small subunit